MPPHIAWPTSQSLTSEQEKLNEAVMLMNKGLQEINVQNMNMELVATMFKNYRSNVLFHLEGIPAPYHMSSLSCFEMATDLFQLPTI